MDAQTQSPQSEAVVFAKTRSGIDLPVIDFTNPRFAVPEDPNTVRALYAAFVESERKRRLVPKFIMRMMLRSAAKKSLLVRSLFQSKAGFLDGISTYMMKLGTGNLVPPFNSEIDRKFAASPHVPLLRLRMQQTARLLCDGLIADLLDAQNAPLDLINIGGGPALDSINALVHLNRTRPELLKRPIAIHVLDSDEEGPFFGANALDALKATGRPLHGLDIVMDHRCYDWNAPALLEQLVRELAAKNSIIAASSEGALFEYGSDAAIVANLKALHADGGGAKQVAGSVTRGDETRKRMIAETGFTLIPRGLEGFAPLAAQAGFSIAKVENAMLSDQVLLSAVAVSPAPFLPS
ncbi:MAG TPA: hypothetical protein VHT51_13685 [Micropepsaceae bacterium]|jgi:hypothetical protein|nr:hypothetical protein [Micropepsaceae bacterium]